MSRNWNIRLAETGDQIRTSRQKKREGSQYKAHNGLCVELSLPGAEEVAPCGLFSGIPEHSTNGLWPCLLVNFLCPKMSGSRLIWAGALGNREKKKSGYEASFFLKTIWETSKSALSVGCCVRHCVCWESQLEVIFTSGIVCGGAGVHWQAQIRINWQWHWYHCVNRKFLTRDEFSWTLFWIIIYCCCCSVAKLCLTLWPHELQHARFPVLHHLLEFVQTHVHWVSDAIQSFHPLSPPSPLALNCSRESALHIRWPKYWSFSFSISSSSEHSGLISFRTDWFGLLAVQGTLKNLLRHPLRWVYLG